MKDYQLSEKIIDNTTHYYATFISPKNEEITEKIDKSIYDIINESQISMSSQARIDRRYGVCSFDESIGEVNYIDEEQRKSMMTQVINEHMEQLTDIQKRRVEMYCLNGMTLQEIAKIEGFSPRAIKYSLDGAKKKFKKYKKVFN